MPLPEATGQFYRQLQRLQVVLVTAGRRAWAGMDPDDFDRSWRSLLPDLLLITTASQLAAARAATSYVPAVLAETGQPDAPEARVRPLGFAGVAADGRSLPGLLQGAVVRAKESTRTRIEVDEVDVVEDGETRTREVRRIVPGLPPQAALAVGGRWLDGLLQTTVTDAGRLATAAEISTRQGMGWVRMVNPPCCGRCAILAGRWYRWSDGFRRHPRCDCVHIPSAEQLAGDFTTDPAALFDSGQITGLTRREQERLAAGEDPVAVINESRDMWRARQSEQRRAERDAAKAAARGDAPPPADPANRDAQARRGLEDLFASTGSRVDALSAARTEGYLL